MAYTGNPATVPADAVRLYINDVDPATPFLSDPEIDYFLALKDNDIIQAAVAAARVILFKLSNYVRAKNDLMETFDNQQWQQYKDTLEMFIKANDAESPDRSVAIALTKANGYAGGISISDMQANNDNADNNIPIQVFVFDRFQPRTGYFTE